MPVRCSNCGTENREGAKFCRNCRAVLPASESAATPPPGETLAPTQSGVAPAAPSATPDAPSIGLVPPPSDVPTTPAGTNSNWSEVVPPTVPGPSAPPPAASPGQIYCPNCGTLNRPSAKFCSNCRTPLSAESAVPTYAAPVAPPPAPPPVQPAPVLLQTAPAPLPASPAPPGGLRLVLLVPFLCMCLALASGLSGVFAYESGLVSLGATSTPAFQVASNSPTPLPTIATPTPQPTFTPAPPTETPNPEAQVLLKWVAAPIPPDENKGWTAWPGQFGFRTADNMPLTFTLENKNDIPDGRTNNTRVWVDGPGASFGSTEGVFGTRPTLSPDGKKLTTVWKYKQVVFTQIVELALSTETNKYDTYRISYSANNQDDSKHEVNVRLMIDTLIGKNDGVTFSIPGRDNTIAKPMQIKGSEIADYYPVRVLERDNLQDPGVTLQVLLSGAGATRPSHLEISMWCYLNVEPAWDYLEQFGAKKDPNDLRQCGDPGRKLDSAIGFFFEPKVLQPGESADWVTYYGRGTVLAPAPVVAAGASNVTLFALPQQAAIGEQFPIIALVQDPKPGQSVEIVLPPQLQLVEGEAKQAVTQTNVKVTQISWKVKTVQSGEARITVRLNPEGVTMDTTVSVVTPPPPTATLAPTPCIPSPFNRCFVTPTTTP